MSKISFLGLGGLGEIGKNLYVLDVDDSIFILDCGLKYPSMDLLGVDAIYPDITYLIENSDRIKAIFLSHGHEEHIGAAIELIKRFNVSVFGSHFTISVLEHNILDLGLNVSDYRLYRINEEKELKFGKTRIEFYNVNHSIPETLNFAIITADSAIVYAPDFTFDVNNDERYRISFNRINDIAKTGVLAVLSESVGTSNYHRTKSNMELDYYMNNALNNKGRVLITLYSYDLEKIQHVIDIALLHNRRIALIGRKTQKIVNIGISTEYLRIPSDKMVNLKFRTEINQNEDDDLVVLITGVRHEPFFMLQRMCNGSDMLVQLKKDDNVIILTPPVVGSEKIASRTLGIVLERGVNLMQIAKEDLRSTHASNEDLKMLYRMMMPKYIIPICGEYRHQIQSREVAMSIGYNKDNVILLDNGDVVTFIDGEKSIEKNKVSHGDVLVDGSMIGDINDVVIKDREILAMNGIVIVSLALDYNHHLLLGEPIIESKGCTFANDEELFMILKRIVIEKSYLYVRKSNININKAIEYLRKELGDYIYKEYKEKPVIIINMIDVK